MVTCLRAAQLWAWGFLCISFMALIVALSVQIRENLNNSILVKRNFFGVLKVLKDEPPDPSEHRIVLMHGRIEHGYQFTAEDKRYWPTSYFGPSSGVGIAIRYHPRRLDPARRHLRVEVVGLGTGTIAAYGEWGTTFGFMKSIRMYLSCQTRISLTARIALHRSMSSWGCPNLDGTGEKQTAARAI